jgi:hypothetical protein
MLPVILIILVHLHETPKKVIVALVSGRLVADRIMDELKELE